METRLTIDQILDYCDVPQLSRQEIHSILYTYACCTTIHQSVYIQEFGFLQYVWLNLWAVSMIYVTCFFIRNRVVNISTYLSITMSIIRRLFQSVTYQKKDYQLKVIIWNPSVAKMWLSIFQRMTVAYWKNWFVNLAGLVCSFIFIIWRKKPPTSAIILHK